MNESKLTAESAEDAKLERVLNHLSKQTIGAAIEVHRALGPGLLESAYEICLCHELKLRGISFTKQQAIPVDYKRIHLDCGYRADIVVADRLLVELKAIDSLLPIHDAQLLSYLKLGGWKCGLLINFNVRFLKQGIRRRVLGLPEQNPKPSLRPPRPLR